MTTSEPAVNPVSIRSPRAAVETTLPTPTTGVLTARLGALGVVFEPTSARLHLLNPVGRIVWDACVAGATRAAISDALVGAGNVRRFEVDRAVDEYLDRLRAGALVEGEPWAAPAARPKAANDLAPDRTDDATTLTVAVLDEVVRIRVEVTDPDRAAVLGELRRLLAPLATTQRPSIELVVSTAAGPGFVLTGPEILVEAATPSGLVEGIPSALNQLAATTTTCLTLHAAAVISPEGRTVLLAGVSGSGKSTLCAQLVQAGWGYLGDEAIGLRADRSVVPYPKPLALDATSRTALGLGETGSSLTALAELDGVVGQRASDPPAAIVMPTYRKGASPQADRLEEVDALTTAASHALNLRDVGQLGLDVLIDVAQQTPCHELVHGGGAKAVAAVHALAT